MSQVVSVRYSNNTSSTERSINLPEICPHCGRIIQPHVYGGFFTDSRQISFGVLVRCTSSHCSKYFSLQYLDTGYSSTALTRNYEEYTYRPPINITLPEGVEHVSPSFVEIFSQATVAESEKLNQIAGVGYRKSLEFLVKDYAIRYFPSDKEKIKNMMLGPVIKNYLTDFKKLQNLATAATWIGNDETHYTRRHEDKDIESMKRFIRAAAQYIAAEFDAEDATEFTKQ
ncbi:DUF4145 domain-containing protein [Enterococcus gilvus]|uniref:DUF4145 domain-containing protein n=1 Tax=Enterococcus gilvus TaxID=160453 RepID=UPI001C8CC17A|nr:DUF4145 domain-containing protein [Enterococcus gilvus]MBX8938816.1 DUF4145 domain-containing protein [Enterococcus gilvus]